MEKIFKDQLPVPKRLNETNEELAKRIHTQIKHAEASKKDLERQLKYSTEHNQQEKVLSLTTRIKNIEQHIATCIAQFNALPHIQHSSAASQSPQQSSTNHQQRPPSKPSPSNKPNPAKTQQKPSKQKKSNHSP